MSDSDNTKETKSPEVDDEPDEWDKRIFSTGCSVEHTKLNDCYFETKDWRLCKEQMAVFKKCWRSKVDDLAIAHEKELAARR